MEDSEDRPQEDVEDRSEERRDFLDPKQKARRYQLEVLDKALEENTIIFLETGCGKTLIAVLLIEALSHLIRKPSKKIAVFLVPNRALVEQQAKEIEEHTDLQIGRFCGSMGDGYSLTYAWWQEQLVKYEVFVMTPQVLFNNLHHCLIRMDMIELLVFDECHHAQKRHPYAQIMGDFYHGKAHRLPKIFGLTASPIIGKVDGVGVPQKIDSQIHKLEIMLNAKVYTLKDRLELQSLLPNPNEQVRRYQPSYDSDNWKKLSNMLQGLREKYISLSGCESMKTKMELAVEKKNIDELSKAFRKLEYCLYELGLWCTIKDGHSVLTGCLENLLAPCAVSPPRPAAEIMLFSGGQSLLEATDQSMKEAYLQEALDMLKTADSTAECLSFGDQDDRCDLDEALLSPKLVCLVQAIMENRENYTKCIIFVERVVETTALSSLLNHLKCLSFVRCLPLVGSQSMSQKTQQQTIEKFRSDEVNLLVATEIAEEGLDIQSCSMVIRFDGAPKTTRSFIQSRGRARQKGSTYIVLLESGNQAQLKDVMQLRVKEGLMWEFTANRGATPIFLGEPQLFEVESYKVESTGAIVTTDYSVPLLYRYCSNLPRDEFYQPVPEFLYSHGLTGTVCEIRLPKTAHLQLVSGHPCETEKMARRVSALEACKRLHEVGALTDYLLPASELEEVDMGASKKQRLPADPMLQMELHATLVPDAFQGDWATGYTDVCLFAYALQIVAEPKDREYAHFALFLEAELDNSLLNTVTELCLTKGRILKLQLVSSGQVGFDVNQLRTAKTYQERIFSIVLDETALQDSNQHPLPTSPYWDPRRLYLTLPVVSSARTAVAVDWKCVHTTLSKPLAESSLLGSQNEVDDHTNRKPDISNPGGQSTHGFFQMSDGRVPVEDIINSLVVTVYNGKVYSVVDVLWDMDAKSAFDDRFHYSTYVQYYKKRYKLDILYPKQPLLQAKPLMKMHNFLVKRPEKEAGFVAKAEMLVELLPELCSLKVLGFSTRVINTVSLIPSFMHKIEFVLLAIQLQKKLEANFCEAAKVSARTVLQALTTAKCIEDISLERLELFGDSFLKFAVSKQLFLIHEEKLEGALTKLRQSAISNSSLHRRGVAHGLAMYIHDELFNPLHWIAPGRPSPVNCDATSHAAIHAVNVARDAVDANQVKCNEGHRWLQKKVVADVVEALIGAHLVDGGADAALAFMEWVGISVYFDNHLIAEASTRCAGDVRFIQGKDLSQLEMILGYTFQNKSLLVEALTHPSFKVPSGSCYQRLEFLGDAVLDFLITSHLYATFPELPPGHLTDLRAATVSNECFARVAVRNRLESFLLHENANLEERIKKFVLFMKSLSKESEAFYGWDCNKGPKVLGDLVESIAGAVLIDTGFNINEVWAIFEPLLQPIVTPDTLRLHPVRELLELCHLRKYTIKSESKAISDGLLVIYTVDIGQKTVVAQAQSSDKNKKVAKRLAACQMLQELKNLGYQHHYRTLTNTLIAQGKLEPIDGFEVSSRTGMIAQPVMLDKIAIQKSLNSVAENRKAPFRRNGELCTARNGFLMVTEEDSSASIEFDDKMCYSAMEIIQNLNEVKGSACQFVNLEDVDNEDSRKLSQMLFHATIEEKVKMCSTSGYLVQSEVSNVHTGETPSAVVKEDNLGSPRGIDPLQFQGVNAANFEALMTPSAVVKEYNLGSPRGIDPLQFQGVNASNFEALMTPSAVVKEYNLGSPRGIDPLQFQGVNAENFEALMTPSAVVKEDNLSSPRGIDPLQFHGVNAANFEALMTPSAVVEDNLSSPRGIDPLQFHGVNAANFEALMQAMKKSVYMKETFPAATDNAFNTSILSSTEACVAQVPKIGATDWFQEAVTDNIRKRFVPENLYPIPKRTVPPATLNELPAERNLKNGKSFDENIGRPREDLHVLCAKHKWKQPIYKPQPGYPQGPPHNPRFAYFVIVSWCRSDTGQECTVEYMGDPEKDRRRAMDSAAYHAHSLLVKCATIWALGDP